MHASRRLAEKLNHSFGGDWVTASMNRSIPNSLYFRRNTITMTSKPLTSKPRTGKGRFQWNASGWFGASLGSSAWMIVTACFLVAHNQPTLAMVPTVAFIIVLFATFLLWARRDRIYPFSALMVLLGLLAIAIPIVVIVVRTYGSPDALTAMNWPAWPWLTLVVCAMAPGLMIWFVFLERTATTASDRNNRDPKTVE
jgi:hypothetical protein